MPRGHKFQEGSVIKIDRFVIESFRLLFTNLRVHLLAKYCFYIKVVNLKTFIRRLISRFIS